MTVTWNNNFLMTNTDSSDIVNTIDVSNGQKVPYFTKDRGFSFVDSKNYAYTTVNGNSWNTSSALIKPQCGLESDQSNGAGCSNNNGGTAFGFFDLDRNACAMACDSKSACKSFTWVSGDDSTKRFIADNIDHTANTIQVRTNSSGGDPLTVSDVMVGDVIIFLDGVTGLTTKTPYYIFGSTVSSDKKIAQISISDDKKTKKSLSGVTISSSANVAINVIYKGGPSCPGVNGDPEHYHHCFLWNTDTVASRSGKSENTSLQYGTWENWDKTSSATTPTVFFARPNSVLSAPDNTYENPSVTASGACSQRNGPALKFMTNGSFAGESGSGHHTWIDGIPDYRACRLPGTIYQQKLVDSSGVNPPPNNGGHTSYFVKCGYTALDQNFAARSDVWNALYNQNLKLSLMYSEDDANKAKTQFCNNLNETNIADSGVVNRCYTHLQVPDNYDFLYNSVANVPDWHTKTDITKAVFDALLKTNGRSDAAKKMIETIQSLPTPLPIEFVKGVNAVLNPHSQSLEADAETIENPIDVLVENYCKQNSTLAMCGCYNAVNQDLAGCAAHPTLPGCNDVALLANAFNTLSSSDKSIATSTLQKPRVYATACAATGVGSATPTSIAYQFNPITGNYQECKNIIINQGSVGGNIAATCTNINNPPAPGASPGSGTQTISSGGGTSGSGSTSGSSIPTWLWILIAVIVVCMSLGGGLAAVMASR